VEYSDDLLRTANLSPAIFFASHFDNLLDHFYRHRVLGQQVPPSGLL
jgi:hypothetical protein